LGELFIAASAKPIEAARAKSIRSVALITIVILLLGIPVSLVVIRRKLNPLSVITARLKQVDIRDFDISIPVEAKNEFGYLAETLRTMGSRLSAAQKHLIESERIARELEIARDIQYSLLPKSFPSADQYSISGEYMSAREVGGDYYDFIEFDDKHLGIIVADVSGKSLPGMLVMLMTRDLVKSLCRELRDPARILTDLNTELKGNIRKGMFVTMFLGILNKDTGEFCFASAGHNPLIHINGKTGEARSIKTKGFPLGTLAEAGFSKRIETDRLQLGDDDWLVQFTDGVNEAHNAKDEEYGTERFISCLANARQKDPQMLVSNVMEDLKSFVGDAESYDDITLVALKWRPQSTDHECRVSMGAANAV
jgi:sigma-B regulation protein RsbU (phosphoserine phosphatase)